MRDEGGRERVVTTPPVPNRTPSSWSLSMSTVGPVRSCAHPSQDDPTGSTDRMPIRTPAPMRIPPGSALAAGAFVYATPERRHVVHEAAVAEIVGLIRAKYEDEGLRNFAFGKRAFEHAQW